MLDFNKIVKILWKKWWKIFFRDDIFEIIDPEKKPQYTTELNKIIYRLKAQKIILPLKSGVYIVPSDEDRKLNSVDLLESYYVRLLKKYITQEVGSYYLIGGRKSLELHLKDMSIPEKIYIITRNTNKKIKVGNYEIIFKTLSGKSQGKKLNLYTLLAKNTSEIEYEGVSFKVANLELALFEAALVWDPYEWVDITLLVKALKKYQSVLNADIFYELGAYKYNMSVNRLKEIAKPLSPDLYRVFLDIIKQNWGCFVGEGLRNM